MKTFWILFLFLSWYDCGDCQNFSVDPLAPMLRVLMDIAVRNLGASSDNPEDLRRAEENHRLQPRVNDDVPFPCSLNNSRSETPPTSVHLLLPGDIEVIGAMGDSLAAGQGILATMPTQVFSQGRGLSFSGGGRGTWRQFLTLPNILKEFNPNLTGFATKDSTLTEDDSQFNVAEGGSLTKDMLLMAQELIKRMTRDPRVNIKTDWKIITIYFGNLDFCMDICFYKSPEGAVDRYRKELTMTLRMLKKYLPRTIVNVMVPYDLKNIRSTTSSNRNMLCLLMVNTVCPCLYGRQFQTQQDRLDKIYSKWKQVQIEVVNRREFDTDEFTVVLQPFLRKYSFPKTKEGLTDYSHLSGDCVHMSQKENARAALSLWNNMLEPIGEKGTTMSNLYDFKCPSADHPYIYTRRNGVQSLTRT